MHFRRRARRMTALLIAIGMCSFSRSALAQDDVLQAVKKQLAEVQQQLKSALDRIDQLEKERSANSSRLGEVEKSVQAVQSAPSALNPAIGLVLDANVQKRGTAGGTFDFRSAEIGIAASVDPFARLYSFFNGTNEGVEVDEAAAVTTSLPWNLTAKGGRFLADFGRFPKLHVHELPFVNQPLSIERMVGAETKADGVEVNYLFPTPFFLRATLGSVNKMGEENERLDNEKLRSASQFTYLGRLNTYFDLTDNQSVELGTSLAYTPSVRLPANASGGFRMLNGVDLTYRYQPLGSTVYQGLTWGSEFYANNERFPLENMIGNIVGKRRQSYGGYSYAELKLNKNWSTGFQVDYAPVIDNPSQRTISYSPFLTWNLSEFNRLRFQYYYLSNNYHADKAERGSQFFLQWTTVIGAHTHGFLSR
jgi:hypothetical protein